VVTFFVFTPRDYGFSASPFTPYARRSGPRVYCSDITPEHGWKRAILSKFFAFSEGENRLKSSAPTTSQKYGALASIKFKFF
jgi:hypothetical protein